MHCSRRRSLLLDLLAQVEHLAGRDFFELAFAQLGQYVTVENALRIATVLSARPASRSQMSANALKVPARFPFLFTVSLVLRRRLAAADGILRPRQKFARIGQRQGIAVI